MIQTLGFTLPTLDVSPALIIVVAVLLFAGLMVWLGRDTGHRR